MRQPVIAKALLMPFSVTVRPASAGMLPGEKWRNPGERSGYVSFS